MSAGQPGALDRLIPLVYAELRRLAHEQLRGEAPGHTLDTTGLVHEAYLRLVNVRATNWQDRAHFFAMAAGLMRHVLVDYARSRLRAKRSGRRLRVPLTEALVPAGDDGASAADFIDLEDALTRLEAANARQCRVVECRCITGLSVDETALVLGISRATVKRDLATARAWLGGELAAAAAPSLAVLTRELDRLAAATASLSGTLLAARLGPGLSGRYRLEREVGRGGMAVVFLALDLKLGRQVALKVLEPDLARSIAAPRFLREIAITSRLAHPHILPLHDCGEVDGLLYYVMPFVEGESLRARLRRQHRLPLAAALAITREVADALGFAHGRGVVHGDVKPENILLMAGHAVVADFGIARAMRSAGTTAVTSSMFLGTPAYMSPEQLAGERLDGRSDAYSLGCVLFEMLVGTAPFRGAELAPASRRPDRTVRNARAALPPGFVRILLKALATAPADRYATAPDLARDLARRVTPASESVRRCR